MITLEISPDTIGKTAKPGYDMNTEPVGDNWEKTIIQRSPSGEIIGSAKQTQNPRHTVRFFEGKGGFCAVVANDKVTYFGLPGSRIVLPDTEVELAGDYIAGKDASMLYQNSHTPPQTHTRQAMILGAGLATRFEPISGDTTGYPKPGVPLVGEDAVITVIAKLLKKHGFKRILINTFYKPECLKRQLEGLEGLEIVYIDEDAPSGTAGGLFKALKQGLVDTNEPILVIQGDAITDADLSFLVNTHNERQATVTIGGQIVPDKDVNKFGIIETDGSGEDKQSGNITSFKEKPTLEQAGHSRFANAGFYILSPQVYELFEKAGEKIYELKALYDYAQDFFTILLTRARVEELLPPERTPDMTFWAQAVGGYWSDIGNPSQYVEAVRDAYAGHIDLALPRNMQEYYEDGVVYWPGAKAIAVSEGAQLEGNVIVARHSRR